MLDSQKHKFFDEVREFEKKLTEYNCDKNRTKEFLYYNRLTKTLENVSCIFPTGYEGLIKIVRRHRPFRVPSKFIEAVASFGDSDSYSSWNRFPFLATYNPDNHLKNSEDNKRYFPLWSKFIFDNSTDFKRRILNTCFSLSCDIIPGVPWENMIAYVGHSITPENKKIVEMLHARGVRCMISVAPTHDKLPSKEERALKYKEEIDKRPDIIESDIPTEVWTVLQSR